MSRIVVISPTTYQDRIDAVLAEAGVASQCWDDQYAHVDPSKVVEACDEVGASVVCLGPDLPLQVALDIAAAFDRERPECGVLLLAESTTGVFEAALRTGVRDVVSPTASDEVLRTALQGVLIVAERRHATLNQARDLAATAEASRVITVLSPKGGSGKTTVATNLSVGLAGVRPGAVALVDLDLQFGDVASALQLTPEHTMADVAKAPRDFDGTMLKVFLTAHPSGLYSLCAPHTPAEADDVSTTDTTTALQLLRSEFPFVVVDTGAGIDEQTLAAIDASTDVVLVGAMDVAGVRSLRKELDVLERLGMTGQRRHLVLNRSDAKVGMDAANIEAVLGMPIDVSIPSSRLIPISTNDGTPVLEGAPRSPVARSLVELVERFVPPDPVGAGLAGRLLRRGVR